VVYFFDESSHQKLCDLLTDGPMFPLIELMQVLFHWLGAMVDLQGVLGHFPWNARYV